MWFICIYSYCIHTHILREITIYQRPPYSTTMSPLRGRVLNSKEKELTVVNVLSLGCVGVGVLVLTLQCHCARRCRCRELGNMEPLYFFFTTKYKSTMTSKKNSQFEGTGEGNSSRRHHGSRDEAGRKESLKKRGPTWKGTTAGRYNSRDKEQS